MTTIGLVVGHQNAVDEQNSATVDDEKICVSFVVTIKGMLSLLATVAHYLRAFLLPRHRLALETVALRQQLAVFKRKQPRPQLRKRDRIFW